MSRPFSIDVEKDSRKTIAIVNQSREETAIVGYASETLIEAALADLTLISTMAERPVMYLEQEDWSPRYQDTFYTVRLDDFQRFASTPKTATSNNDSDSLPSSTLGGKTNFPAYYYKIHIFCGRHDPKVVFRRYSQFKWLYQNIPLSTTGGDPSEEPIQFPPGNGCLCSQNDDFAKNRTEQLREFLNEALVRRDVARDEAVAQFLELDSFVKTEKS